MSATSKTFDNFVVPVPEGVDVARYAAVVVWCESFRQFITGDALSLGPAYPRTVRSGRNP